MFRRIYIPLGLVAIATAPAAFAGSGTDNPWSIGFSLGSELIPSGGRWHSRHSTTIANLGTIDPALAGQSGSVVIHSRTFKDAFRDGPAPSLELGYDLSSQFSTFARLSYAQLDGRTTDIGDIVVSGRSLPTAIRGKFDDVRSWGLDLGARYFLTDSSTVAAVFRGLCRCRSRRAGARAHQRGWQAGGLRYRGTAQAADTLQRGRGVRRELRLLRAGRAALLGWRQLSRVAAQGVECLSGSRPGRVRVSDQSWTLPLELGLTFKF